MGPLEEWGLFFTTELSHLVKWMAPERMLLSEKSQMQKDRYHLFPAIDKSRFLMALKEALLFHRKFRKGVKIPYLVGVQKPF